MMKKTKINDLDCVAYMCEGQTGYYPVMKRNLADCVDMFDYIEESTKSVNSFLIRANAWIEACCLDEKSKQIAITEAKVYIDGMFLENTYDEVKDEEMSQKTTKLATWLESKRFKLVSGKSNQDTLIDFTYEAINNGASYSKVMSWLPKFKKIQGFCKSGNEKFNDYNDCVNQFYNQNNLIKEQL